MSRFADDPARRGVLWLPWWADRRGRLYSLSSVLTPLGGDFHRALRGCRNSRPLGDREGYRALLRWFAACGDAEKLSINEQIDWAEKRVIEAERIAKDSISLVDEWSPRSDPWQFLACCFEIAALREHMAGGDDLEDFATSLPVHSDASCSGLQHLSLTVLDRSSALRTNLLGGERQDLYGEVANVLKEILRDRVVDHHDSTACVGLGSDLINRDFIKRPVTATPYNVSDRGTRNALVEKLDHALLLGSPVPFDRSCSSRCRRG